MDAKYASIRPPPRPVDHDDDVHSSHSSLTEVDESLLGGEAKWRASQDDDSHDCPQDRRPHRARRLRAAVFRWGRWGLDTVLLLAILGLLVRQQLTPAPAEHLQLDFGGDFTGVGPRINQQVRRFQSDPSYAPKNTSQFFTPEVLQHWNELMPVGMGFVWVNDTHRYHDLPTPIEWPDKTVFTTSVTHQIHCLFTIAQTYSGLSSGHPIPPDHHWHMIHCIDYMREAVLCSADLALEGHETTFPDDNGGSDGWDSTHICKDYSQVKKYLESVRAYDDQLIY